MKKILAIILLITSVNCFSQEDGYGNAGFRLRDTALVIQLNKDFLGQPLILKLHPLVKEGLARLESTSNVVLVYDSTTGQYGWNTYGGGSGGSGTVTSITGGYGLSGGTITTSGTLLVDSNYIATRLRLQKVADSLGALITGGGGSPGGSNKQVQYNNSGTFAGAAGVEIGNTNNRLLIQSQASSEIPVQIKPEASQTANLQEWYGVGNTYPTYIDKDGAVSFQHVTSGGYNMNIKHGMNGADSYLNFYFAQGNRNIQFQPTVGGVAGFINIFTDADGFAFNSPISVTNGVASTAFKVSGYAGISYIETELYSGVTINQDGDASAKLRVEGDTDPNLIYTDPANDRIGIGTNTPGYKLDVSGTINVAGTTGNVYRWNAASGTPSNTATPAGWVRINVAGTDSWLPYYQ